jgi:hypothetical protein
MLSAAEVDAVNGGFDGTGALLGAGAAWFFGKYGDDIVDGLKDLGEDIVDWFKGLF